MLSLRAHIELEIADRVAAVREKRDLLVQLKALRLQDLVQAPFRFGVHGLHKAKTLARGRLLILVASKGQGALAGDDLEVMLLCLPIPHIAPVNPDGDRPIWDGEVAPSPGTTVEETPLFCSQLCFAAFSNLHGGMAYRLDIERDIERQEVDESFDGQAIRNERGPLRLHEEQLGCH